MKYETVRNNLHTPPKIVFLLLLVLLISSLAPDLRAQEKQVNKPRIDPFYLKLFEEAKHSFYMGDFETAFQNFKLAAFGFLDEPDLLGEALVYLTVTAYNLNKDDQVTHYLKEIMRFKLSNRISASPLPPELKKKFEKIQADFRVSNNG